MGGDSAQLLAVDLGTSSVKVGVFAADGRLLSFARRAYGRAQVAGEVAEQDPEVWWSSTAEAIREAASDLDLRQVGAVCVGGQGPTLVLVDAEGRPVRPALSWMDARSTTQGARLSRALGTDGAAFSLVPRLLWVAENEPGSYERARWALQAWDFIAARLGGGRIAAASTFAGDVVWRGDWLTAAGLSGSGPHPRCGGCGRGVCRNGWAMGSGGRVAEGIPIIGGMNDGVGSIVGAAGSVVGRATDPGGAAGGLALCWHERVSAPGVDCWAGLVPGTHIIGGAFVAGGRLWTGGRTSRPPAICSARSRSLKPHPRALAGWSVCRFWPASDRRCGTRPPAAPC